MASLSEGNPWSNPDFEISPHSNWQLPDLSPGSPTSAEKWREVLDCGEFWPEETVETALTPDGFGGFVSKGRVSGQPDLSIQADLSFGTEGKSEPSSAEAEMATMSKGDLWQNTGFEISPHSTLTPPCSPTSAEKRKRSAEPFEEEKPPKAQRSTTPTEWMKPAETAKETVDLPQGVWEYILGKAVDHLDREEEVANEASKGWYETMLQVKRFFFASNLVPEAPTDGTTRQFGRIPLRAVAPDEDFYGGEVVTRHRHKTELMKDEPARSYDRIGPAHKP